MRITQTRLDRLEKQLGAELDRVRRLSFQLQDQVSGMTLSATGSQQPIVCRLLDARRDLRSAVLQLEGAEQSICKAATLFRDKARAKGVAL